MRGSLQAVVLLVAAGCGLQATVPGPEVTRCALEGEPRLVAGQLEKPRLLTLDGEAVWWVQASSATPSTDSLWRAAKRGAQPERVAAGLPQVWGLAAHAGQVFWADGSKQLWTLRDGAPAVLLANAGSVRELVADARGLVFIDSFEGTVKKATLDGSGVTTLATGQRGPADLMVDETHAYWLNVEGHKISAFSVMKAALAGGEAATLVGEHDYATGIELDATHVYVSTGERLLKVGKNGEGLEVVLSMQSFSRGPVGDASRLYFSRYGAKGGSAVVSFDKRTKEVVTLAESPEQLFELRADATGVYWLSRESTGGLGAISRACE